MEYQANFREASFQQGNQPGQDLDLRRGHHTDDEFGGFSLLRSRRTLPRPLDAHQNLLGVGEKHLASFRERHVTLTAIQQWDA